MLTSSSKLVVALLLASSHHVSGQGAAQQKGVFKATLFSKFNIEIDATKSASGQPMIRYSVDMPANTYLGLCYGEDMRNTDMVAFLANGQTVRVQDLFAFGNSRPPSDSQNDYTNIKVGAGSAAGRFNVSASRLLDTGDTDMDSVIPLVRFDDVNYSTGQGVPDILCLRRFLKLGASRFRYRKIYAEDRLRWSWRVHPNRYRPRSRVRVQSH
jgi:hypothetical protein